MFDKFVNSTKRFLHRRAAEGFALPLVKHFESYYPHPYVCSGGKLTIGYGHVIQPGDPHYVTEREAAKWLVQELRKCYIPSAISALDAENIDAYNHPSWFLGAITSAVYNTGPVIVTEGSWVEFWKQGDLETAAERFYLWNKAGEKTQPGLVRRRMAEWQLLTTGTWESEPAGWRDKYNTLK